MRTLFFVLYVSVRTKLFCDIETKKAIIQPNVARGRIYFSASKFMLLVSLFTEETINIGSILQIVILNFMEIF